jgi:hypothetical protein
MAGPPQISDPSFEQFSAAGPADTGTGEAVAAIGKGVADVITAQQTHSLRSQVKGQRQDFLEMLGNLKEAGIDPNDPVLSPEAGQDGFISLDVDTVVALAANNTQGDQIELQAMTGEIAAHKRAVEQGITPNRALELNVEKITRQYIDRFPGLSRQFQAIAQTALGTENNLLTTTMRTIDEAARAAEAGDAQQEAFLNELAKVNPRVLSPNQNTREEAIVSALTILRNREQTAIIESADELRKRQGGVSVAGIAINNAMAIKNSNAMVQYSEDLMSVVPPELQDGGFVALNSSYNSLSDEQRIEAIDKMKFRKQAAIKEYLELTNMFELDEGQRSTMNAHIDVLSSHYDSAIESLELKSLSGLVESTLDIVANSNLREWEVTMGRDALVAEKFLKHLPPNHSLRNKYINDREQSAILPMMLAFAGRIPLEEQLELSGVPKNDAKDLIDVFNVANVNAIRDVLRDPNTGHAAVADSNRMLRAMDKQFLTATDTAKKAMLDLVADPQFKEHYRNADVTTRQAMKSLTQNIGGYGAEVLEQMTKDTLNSVASPDMVREFGIRRAGVIGPTSESPSGGILGLGSAAPSDVQTGQLVRFSINANGVSVAVKSNEELAALGVDTSTENLQRINRMVNTWNRRGLSDYNSYLRAIDQLDAGLTRDQLSKLVLGLNQEEEPTDADVREE